MIIQEDGNIKGYVKIYELPTDYTFEDFKNLRSRDGYLKDEGENLVVTLGIYTLLDCMLDITAPTFYSQPGTSSTAVATTDTALNGAISPRVQAQDVYRVSNVAYFDTFYGKNDNAGTWAEAGLFVSLTGNMIAHKLVSFTKSTSNACVLSWQLTLT